MALAERARSAARRCLAYVVGLGLPVAVLSPIWSGAPDSFPLSTYPMFARPRGQPTLHMLVGLAADGSERRLSPELVGSKEVLQAKVLIQRSVDEGAEAMAQLCQSTAARVAQDAAFRELQALAIVARRYDPVDYFVNGPSPLEQQILVRCDVPHAGGTRTR
ncbi:MAG: hypothetical protein RL033_2031 [Pseudomonadota bacterium]|jgi:hypothetical protein